MQVSLAVVVEKPWSTKQEIHSPQYSWDNVALRLYLCVGGGFNNGWNEKMNQNMAAIIIIIIANGLYH